jgi:hypothetical protein
MFGRNIDFLAVGLIALVMLGFSSASSLRIDRVVGPIPIQLQSASNADSCPIDEVLSRISYILDDSSR